MPSRQHEKFSNFFQVEHPLISSKLTLLRDKTTNQKLFRELVHEITLLLAYEATQTLPIKEVEIQTPMEKTLCHTLAGLDPVILPILRAGIGMVDALSSLLPQAKVGHIGLFRNEQTLQPENYYFKIPEDSNKRRFFVCDPMLATGGSAVRTMDTLKERGVKDITFLCVLAVPEGVNTMLQHHPDVKIYSASMDRQLDEQAYILPGLGDAGDRLFGTH